MSRKRNWLHRWANNLEKRQPLVVDSIERNAFGAGERCIAIKTDGHRCEAAAMRGGYYCKQHIPRPGQFHTGQP